MNSSQFADWSKNRRGPSEAELEALSAIPELNLDLETLYRWRETARIRSLFTDEDLLEALKLLYPDPFDREAFAQRLLNQNESE